MISQTHSSVHLPSSKSTRALLLLFLLSGCLQELTLLGADLDAVRIGFTHEFDAKPQDPICSPAKVEEILKINVCEKKRRGVIVCEGEILASLKSALRDDRRKVY